jgi:hypothetical protein
MDRMARTKEHLAQAERHVAEGERHVTRQRELLAELRRSAQRATDLLHQFKELQALHIADRDRLRKEAKA